MNDFLTATANTYVDADDFATAVAALEQAGVMDVGLAGDLAKAVLSALVASRPALCAGLWDEDTTCALPAGHTGWHASAPSYDPERGVKSGTTWTQDRPAAQHRLNVGGYVGESTRSEVEYAAKRGKPIRWLEGTDYRRPATSGSAA